MGGGGSKNKIPETTEEKALAEIATEEFRRNQDVISPLVDDFIANEAVMSDSDYAMGANLATSQVADKLSGQVGQAMRGVNPNSGAASRALADIATVGGQSKAAAAADTTTGLYGAENQRLMNLVSMGRGQNARAVEGLNAAARGAAQRAVADANADYKRRAGMQNTIMSGVGALTAVGANSFGGTQPSSGSGFSLSDGDLGNGALSSSGSGGLLQGRDFLSADDFRSSTG